MHSDLYSAVTSSSNFPVYHLTLTTPTSVFQHPQHHFIHHPIPFSCTILTPLSSNSPTPVSFTTPTPLLNPPKPLFFSSGLFHMKITLSIETLLCKHGMRSASPTYPCSFFPFWAAAPEGQMTYDSTQDDFFRFPSPPL